MKKGDEAFNRHDIAAMNAAHHPDMIAHVTGSDKPTYGRAALAAALEGMFRAFPDIHVYNDPYPIQFGDGDWMVGSGEQVIKVQCIRFQWAGCGGNGLALGHHVPPPPLLPPPLCLRQQSTANAGVVDKDVRMALAFVDHRQGSLHRRVVGHVELHELGAELGRGRLSSLDAPRPHIDGMPVLDQLAGGLVAESLVGSGDECLVLPCSSLSSHVS